MMSGKSTYNLPDIIFLTSTVRITYFRFQPGFPIP